MKDKKVGIWKEEVMTFHMVTVCVYSGTSDKSHIRLQSYTQ